MLTTLGMPWPEVMQWLRRWERRYYYADYAEAALRQQWLDSPTGLPVEEVRVPMFFPRESTRTIVVFKPDDIGDTVQALPALWELRKALPEAKITVLAQEKATPIFEKTAVADSVLPIRAKSRLRRFPKIEELPLERFDLGIFLRTHPSYFHAYRKLNCERFLHPQDPRMRSSSPYQVYANEWGERGEHQALQMLRIVSPLTGKKYGRSDIAYPRWNWSEPEMREARKFVDIERPYLVLHPHVRDETRRYPKEYWANLVQKIAARFEVRLFSIGAKGESEKYFDDSVGSLEGKLGLASTAYLLSRAAGVIGVSSGPSHIASALGTPTITLLGGGASYVREWAPLGKSLVVRSEIACAPCNLTACPGNNLQCLTELTPERVFPSVEKFLLAHGAPLTGKKTLH